MILKHKKQWKKGTPKILTKLYWQRPEKGKVLVACLRWRRNCVYKIEFCIVKDKIVQPKTPNNEFELPAELYTGSIPISRVKYNDLQKLKKFCSLEAKKFYNGLKLKKR